MGRDNRIRYRLGLTALLLVICMILSTGTAFARYRKKLDPFEYRFQTKPSAEVFLGGLDEVGNLTSLPGSWIIGPSGNSLTFGVSNGSAKMDVDFVLQIVVSSNVKNGGALGLTLTPEGEETGLTAKVTKIQQGTQLYEEFGTGWIYRFWDSEGKEQSWTLAGGGLSVFRGELLCKGNVTDENSGMLQLQVIAVP